MKIGVIGDKAELKAMEAKFSGHQIELLQSSEIVDYENSIDLFFHFTVVENQDHLDVINQCQIPLIFLNTVKTSLAELSYLHGELRDGIFGFNGMPGFFDRPFLEVTSRNESRELAEQLTRFNFEYHLVADRVGMVTPRVICMIINEAFYTFQEGTAGKEDIDLGMKLGTNYPYGPFEWLEIIGIREVYELLEALYDDTKDPRYKICPLLKRDYLMDDH